METNSRPILGCRLCKEKNLTKVLDFGFIPLGNNLKESINHSLDIDKYPLVINQCQNCHHFQLSYSVDSKLLYATNYTYLSGVAKSFREHLEQFSIDVLNYNCLNNIKIKTKVIDIGTNDGNALSYFKKKGCKVLGIDPAKIPSEIANKNNIKTINDFFSLKLAKRLSKDNQLADIIISHNVLAHVEDINDVFKGINHLLKPNGLFVFEVGYLGDIVSENIYDTIYHEHLDYHSKRSLIKFLLKNKFSIEDLETNKIQGGSLRLYSRKNSQPEVLDKVKQQILLENNVLSKENIEMWKLNIFKNIENIKLNIENARLQKINIWGYGAPTKAALVINMLGLDANYIEFIIEDNKLKEQKYIPGTSIPIIMKNKIPFYKKQLIICFTWNFFDDIYLKLVSLNIKGPLLNIQSGEKLNL